MRLTEASVIEMAYGALWREHGTSPRLHEARRLLLGLLDKEGQRRGIAYAIAKYGSASEAEILHNGM